MRTDWFLYTSRHYARKSGLVLLASALAIALAACGSPEPTPTATSAPMENTEPEPTGFEAEWSELIEAAQDEGELVFIFGGAASRTQGPLLEEFSNKFGIDVVPSRGSGGENADRILAERSAGRYTADVAIIHASTINLRFVPNGVVDPIGPELFHPEVTDESLWFGGQHWYGDAEQQYIFLQAAAVSEETMGQWYNTDRVSQEDLATLTSYDALLTDRWKGKVAALAPTAVGSEGSYFGVYAHPELGPDVLERVIREGDIFFSGDYRVLQDGLAQGKYDMGIWLGTLGRDMRTMRDQGVSVDDSNLPAVTEVGSLAVSGDAISVFNQRPHPNATKLFVNWLLSREGQTARHELIDEPNPTLRDDDIPWGATAPEDRREPGVSYPFLDADPELIAKYDEAIEFARRIYREVY